MSSRFPALFLIALFSAGCTGSSAPSGADGECVRETDWGALETWDFMIEEYEAADVIDPPDPGAVVFVGSSSVRFWGTLAEDMAPMPALNRGFGGSIIVQATNYAERIVLPYLPSAVVLYSGENDVAIGSSADCVLLDYEGFVQEVRAAFPSIPIYFVSIKPTPGRLELWDEMQRANELIEMSGALDDSLHFIDVSEAMLDAQGEPDEALFGNDGVHMNDAGYALWTSIIGPRLAADLGY